MGQTLRTFIALELSEPVKKIIQEAQTELKKTGADVKWVPPPNCHLTLYFLGDTTIEQIEKTKTILFSAVEGIKPFTITISHLGAFPNLHQPRIIWIGMSEGLAPLRSIVKVLEKELPLLGFPKEDREFAAHVTLGRFRSSQGKAKITQALPSIKIPQLTQEVGDITFFQSTLTPQGPIYQPLFKAPLK